MTGWYPGWRMAVAWLVVTAPSPLRFTLVGDAAARELGATDLAASPLSAYSREIMLIATP
jgi:hypothetical protein